MEIYTCPCQYISRGTIIAFYVTQLRYFFWYLQSSFASVIDLVTFRNCNLTNSSKSSQANPNSDTPLTCIPPPPQSRLTTWTCRWGWKPGRGDSRRCTSHSQIRPGCVASRCLSEFPSRSYSSTSFEDAVKKAEEPPTPPPRPQKSHSRASSLDLNKLFQQGAPGTIHSLFKNQGSGKSPRILLGCV